MTAESPAAKPRPPARVVVVGGGIAGLAGAHRLAELGVGLVLLERSERWGGALRTEVAEGFLVEAGADSFLARKPWASELCRRAGLGEELVPTERENRGSFVLRRGRLHPLPEGLTGLVPTRLAPLARSTLLSPAEKLRVLLEPLVPRGAEREDESLADFFARRLGRGASAALVEPLVRGIYGGDPRSLSLRATFPQLADLERRHGSLLRGLAREARGAAGPRADSGFLSLRRGMASLASALADRLPAGARRLGCGLAGVARALPAEPFRLRLLDGTTTSTDALVLAVPAPAAADVLATLDPELAAELRRIGYGSSVTVSLGWERARVRHPLRGHGFVVAAGEAGPLLACTWASSKFAGRAPEGAVLLRAFLEPAALAGGDDAELARLATDALRPLLGLQGEPRLVRVHRWSDALPRYSVGHEALARRIEERARTHPGLFLAGAAYRGVGIPDVVRSGTAAAESAARFLAGRLEAAGLHA